MGQSRIEASPAETAEAAFAALIGNVWALYFGNEAAYHLAKEADPPDDMRLRWMRQAFARVIASLGEGNPYRQALEQVAKETDESWSREPPPGTPRLQIVR